MVEKKLLFFDIDATLTDAVSNGAVLPSTKTALSELRRNGHFIALATGREYFLAKRFFDEHGFENMVSDGGNGLTLNGKYLGTEPMDHKLAMNVINECVEKNINVSVVAEIGVEPSLYVLEGAEPINRLGIKKRIVYVPTFNEVKEVYKIHIDATNEQTNNLKSIHEIGYTFTPEFGLIIEPLDKFKGIKKMVELIGGNLKDVVVFGDAKNDITMMQQAQLSIAMGNATDEVKEIASFVTKRNDDDGIYYACKHFGWI